MSVGESMLAPGVTQELNVMNMGLFFLTTLHVPQSLSNYCFASWCHCVLRSHFCLTRPGHFYLFRSNFGMVYGVFCLGMLPNSDPHPDVVHFGFSAVPVLCMPRSPLVSFYGSCFGSDFS